MNLKILWYSKRTDIIWHNLRCERKLTCSEAEELCLTVCLTDRLQYLLIYISHIISQNQSQKERSWVQLPSFDSWMLTCITNTAHANPPQIILKKQDSFYSSCFGMQLSGKLVLFNYYTIAYVFPTLVFPHPKDKL